MSKQPFDSFLPSGAMQPIPRFRPDSTISPLSVPRSVPDYNLSPNHSRSSSPSLGPYKQSPSHFSPLSPPKTRSTSADEHSAALIEDWRAYTKKLRSQHEGERAHMTADRARAEEVMAEERALWDSERAMYKARILELEAQLEKASTPPAHHLDQRSFTAQQVTSPPSNAVSVSGSVDSHSSRTIPQESGRNADGSPFYAPAARHPSRTFDTSEADDMRVDSITAPRESAIRVTSKELTADDFGIRPQSPNGVKRMDSISEDPVESIDISAIQPGLEGVSIKLTAVSPTFAAKVLSPQRSPPKLSPDVLPPGRDVTNHERDYTREAAKEHRTLNVVYQPENRRLTMHAGHTPNHSITKFGFLGADVESGNATPTQTNQHVHTEHCPHGEKKSPSSHGSDDGDRELTGPLTLPIDQVLDDPFLAKLTEKLVEVERKSREASRNASPDTSSVSSQDRTLSPERARKPSRGNRMGENRDYSGSREREIDEDDKDEGPILKLKPSINFGAPLGRM